jgi:hypothetical protein
VYDDADSGNRITTGDFGEIAQMNTLAAIGNWSVLAFALLPLAAQLLAHEAGYWLGQRRRARSAEPLVQVSGILVRLSKGMAILKEALNATR